MDTKKNKRVYSKPVVQKPKEEVIKEQVEKVNQEQIENNSIAPEVIEAKPVDPAVFETKLFVEEEPEEIIFSAPVPDELGEIKEIPTLENEAKIFGEDVIPPNDEPLEEVKNSELREKLKEVNKKFENFQTVKVVPVVPEPEPESMYTLTKKQEEEGAQAVADVVNNQIIEELKTLGYESKESATKKIEGEYLLTNKQAKDEGEYLLTDKQAKDKAIALFPELSKEKINDSLSQHDLRHFKRTDQLPK